MPGLFSRIYRINKQNNIKKFINIVKEYYNIKLIRDTSIFPITPSVTNISINPC